MGTSIYNHALRATSCLNVLGILLRAPVRRVCRRAARLVVARGVGSSLPSVLLTLLLPAVAFAAYPFHAGTQSTASIEGQVTDQDGAVVRGAEVAAISRELGLRRTAVTDGAGRFLIAALAVGAYRVEVTALGFQTYVVESATLEVGKSLALNIQLRVGDVSQTVTVTAEQGPTEQATMAVGHMVSQRAIQETPLNGRYFLDLGLRVPGSVTPPQGAFSASPMRGLGSLAFNTAGNREETVNYLVNGITLNNLTFSSISFQLPLSTIREFKVDNSTFGAQYGESSGAVVNIATRSGTNAFHGELFEFLRNDALDARNFFEFNSARS